MRRQSNFKLPEDLITALQERAAAERTTSTDLVIQALNSFLSNSEPDVSRISGSIPDLAQRIEELTQRLNELEAKKHIYFMNNSPLSEANEIHIGIDSDTTLSPSDSQEQFAALLRRFEELVLQNQRLWERVATLEDLIQKSNCQG
ncbi:hypothetical protein H6G96_32630 [Nostoc sp. FACHB-892]|uniref:hypothetical protein n=1 Tax=Nostoc sp. FACHB-892 TaxID=2692843 RepID=UPI001683D3D7|nr:hypothetical protein [Nostoc sp. FACHB-892]MBD2730938.1 hypothetical protein [Nostoc sp. FACHB-892]